MKAPKTINIAHGITAKKLITLLQNNEILLLKGKNKTFKIQKDFIQIFQNQALILDHIPTQINELALNDIQKMQLLNDGIIKTSTHKITLDKNSLQLKVQKPIRQNEQTQLLNRLRVSGHKIR